MKSQRNSTQQQIPLTGSVSHTKTEEIISALGATLTLGVTVHTPTPPHIYARRPGTDVPLTAVGGTGVSDSRNPRTRVLTVPYAQNSRIILGKYLNVKLIGSNGRRAVFLSR